MTAKENYDKLKKFIAQFPKYVENKKDLVKLSSKQTVEYYAYRKYFGIDRRYKPERVIEELKKYKRTNLKFKSEELGLTKEQQALFSDTDKYSSSGSLLAKTTNAMLGQGIKLTELTYGYSSIDTAYKRTVNRKVVKFQTAQQTNFEFMTNLPDTVYINIENKSDNTRRNYNKNGFDFIHDYHNQSNDFAENLTPLTTNTLNLSLYNW